MILNCEKNLNNLFNQLNPGSDIKSEIENPTSEIILLSSPKIVKPERYIIIKAKMESAVFGLIIKIISCTAKAKVNTNFWRREKYKIRGAAQAECAIFKVGGVV